MRGLEVMFRVDDSSVGKSRANLTYIWGDYALGTMPQPRGAALAVCVNEVELMIDEQSLEVVGVRGYCPLVEGTETVLCPSDWARASLFVRPSHSLVPGVVQKVNTGARWPVIFDRETGWVRLGPSVIGEPNEVVAFIEGAVATLVSGRLVNLHLHPRFVDAST